MKKKLKFKTGEKVIYRSNVGGFGGIKEMEAEVLFAHIWKGQRQWPYIIRTKKYDTFSLERDLRKR